MHHLRVRLVLPDSWLPPSRYPAGYLVHGVFPQLNWLADPLPLNVLRARADAVFVKACKNGTMNLSIFPLVLEEIVCKPWRLRFPDGPLLLVMDAPKVHGVSDDGSLDAAVAAVLLRYSIELMTFPHNTSTLLQPLDLKVTVCHD